MKICFVTNNKYKLEEVSNKLPARYHLLALNELNFNEDIPETADTLEGNARLKANYIYQIHKIDCFADDTGLEVDALDGAPGVYSARFAGPEQDANANLNLLMKKMEGVGNRKAKFRTIICLILKGQYYTFEGRVDGHLLETTAGKGGFGYDPVFIPEGYNRTFAEMSMEEKNKISHRARAVDKLIQFFEDHKI